MSDTNTSTPMDEFDFFMSLEDVNDPFSKATKEAFKAEHEEYKASHAEIVPDEWDEPEEEPQYETTDWGFLEEGVKFEDEIEDEHEEERSNLEEAPQLETDNEESEYDYGDEEAVDVDLDTIITLNNKEYTVEDLVNRYREDEIFNEDKAAFEAEKAAFIADKEASVSLIDLNILECDRQIAEYKNFNWDWYATNDPAAYVENKRFVERLEYKKAELMEEHQKLEAQKRYQESEAFRAKSRACVETLRHVIPEWNETLYGNLMQHAIDYYGAEPANVEKWNEPSLFIMLNDAYKAHNDILKAKAVIKRQRKDGKYLRTGANKPTPSAVAKREAAERAYATGKMSNDQAFAFLED